MTTFLPLMTLLACGGGDAPPPPQPTGPKPPADAGADDAEAEKAPPPVDAPVLLALRDDGDACAVATWASPDATPETVGTFEGPCPDTPTWVRHPDAARVLVTWGDRALEIVDVDLDAGTVTRAPALPGATVAAFVPAPVPQVPEEAEEPEEPAGEPAEGEEAAAEAPPPPPPDRVVATQVIRTEARQDGKGSYFEVDGKQLRFDRNASLLYDTTVVRLQAVGDDGWERLDTVLWMREEGAPARAAFPEDAGARGTAHGPDEPQGADSADAPDEVKKLAEAAWYARDADGRAWAHALDIRDATRARTPVAVEVDGAWTLVEGLDTDGPLAWQVAGNWLLAWDGAKTHLVDLTDGSVVGSVDALATAAP